MNENQNTPRCADCKKKTTLCVCDKITRVKNRVRVVILQHPQEDDVDLGTATLVTRALENASLEIGLSWPSLKHAVKDDTAQSKRWGVLFPRKDAVDFPEDFSPESIDGFIVLDGTWSQGKTLWWRNPWLLKLTPIAIHPKEPSIYGRLRREPRREFVSTLEAAAEALALLGEPETTGLELRRAMRTMMQRARDAAKTPTAGA